jgi:opacity protein-like surface antigen
MKRLGNLVVALALSLGVTNMALAQDSYISGFGGLVMKSDSSNGGGLTSSFTTGEGTTIPGGTVLPSGSSLAWDTHFDAGYNFGFAYGMSSEIGFRSEFEVRYLRNGIQSHASVAVAGIDISSEDAGILITGSDNLGVSVAQVVADGRGHMDTWSFMANAYYDFNSDGTVNPYVGGGLGYATTKVMFEPSGVSVADHRDGGFAYQAIGGMDFAVTESMRLFAEYRFFATSNVETELSLLPGTLDVENKNHIANFGVRYHF